MKEFPLYLKNKGIYKMEFTGILNEKKLRKEKKVKVMLKKIFKYLIMKIIVLS
jgi:hypothetical protein